MTHRLALVALVLCLAGCGHAPAPGASARLHVEQLTAAGSPIPIEGAFHYVRVVGEDVDVRRRLTAERVPTTTLELAPGRYRLESWQRTCDGNCGTLDPPSDQCSGEFELESTQRLRATITITYGSGCRIVFA